MRQKVMVVDDEFSMRRLLTRVLESEQYDLLSVSSPLDAVKVAIAAKPDIILLDVDMPEKNGLDVLKDLKENPTTRLVPVILMTGHVGLENEAAGFSMGADCCMAKPFELSDLRAKIASLLSCRAK